MTGRIYLLDESGNLEAMEEQPYEAEVLLQRLLAAHPDLLAGEQMDRREPRRWILVRREARVPDAADSAGRWSLDHLFLDQEGIPTLVEVKRSSDTRARREVVAQMLDYAAHATAYWSVAELKAAFESRCELDGDDPTDVLKVLITDESEVEEFWQRVKTNLTAGRIRMVFVADVIAIELQRIVEFLNEQMDPAEVLAVEVRQFVGEGNRTLVPRVVGQSVEATIRKAATKPGRSWDLESLIEDLRNRHGDDAVAVAERLYKWAMDRSAGLVWGRGNQYGSFSVRLDANGRQHPAFVVSSEGWVDFGLPNLAKHEPFSDPDLLHEFIDRMNRTPGVEVAHDLGKWPRTQLTNLGGNENVFLEVWDWYLERIRSHRKAGER